MAKVFILTEDDIKRLTANLDRNPQYGYSGGSSRVLTEAELIMFKEAHAFYNYQIRSWISEVTK